MKIKKIHNLIFVSIILFILIIFFKCEPTPVIDKSKKKQILHHNYVIMLDLSDRILMDNQITRDKEIILSLYSTFLEKVKKSFYINSKDNFKVVIPFQSQGIPESEIPALESSLNVQMANVPLREKKNIRDSKDSYVANLDQLYKKAMFSQNSNDYKGADIHGYLRDRIKFDLIQDTLVKNYVFIISDGYMFIKNKSGGLADWDPVCNLENVKVALLEIQPNNRLTNEQNRIESTWKNWFSDMKVEESIVLPKNPLHSLHSQINTFIYDNEIKKKEIKLTNSPITIKKKLSDKKVRLVKKEPDSNKITSDGLKPKLTSAIKNGNPPELENSSQTISEKSDIDSQIKTIEPLDIKMSLWYSDHDNDGKGDPNDKINTTGQAPQGGNWVSNADDKCPNRKGTINGCPVLHIRSLNQKVNVGQEVTVRAENSGLLSNDILTWSSHSSIKFITNQSTSVNFVANKVGKYKIKYKVKNDESPISSIAEKEINVTISEDQIRDIIQPIVVQGSAKGSGKFEQRSKDAMTELFRHTLSKRIKVFDEVGLERAPLETFLVSDIKLGLPKNKHNIEITDISYDKVSGKISELYIKFL